MFYLEVLCLYSEVISIVSFIWRYCVFIRRLFLLCLLFGGIVSLFGGYFLCCPLFRGYFNCVLHLLFLLCPLFGGYFLYSEVISIVSFIRKCPLLDRGSTVIDQLNEHTILLFPFPGMNSIVLYMGHEILSDFFPFGVYNQDTNHLTFLTSNLVGVAIWMLISYYWYTVKFFVKI